MATFKSCKISLSDGERISSVDQILSALEEVKVRLAFFLYMHPVYLFQKLLIKSI